MPNATLVLDGGALSAATAGPAASVTVNSTQGGQLVQLLLDRGNFSQVPFALPAIASRSRAMLRQIAVSKVLLQKASNHSVQLPCAIVRITPLANNARRAHLVVRIPSFVGPGWQFVLVYDTPASPQHHSAPSSDVLNYPPPVLRAKSLRLAGQPLSLSTQNLVVANNSMVYNITLDGANFYPSMKLVTMAMGPVSVHAYLTRSVLPQSVFVDSTTSRVCSRARWCRSASRR